MTLGGEIIEKGLDRGGPAAAAGCRQRLGRLRRKRLIAIQLLDPDGFDKVQVNVGNIDLIKRRRRIHQTASAFQKTKQDLQIQIIGHDRAIGMTAHGRMVFQEFHDDVRHIVDFIQFHREALLSRKNGAKISLNLYYARFCFFFVTGPLTLPRQWYYSKEISACQVPGRNQRLFDRKRR